MVLHSWRVLCFRRPGHRNVPAFLYDKEFVHAVVLEFDGNKVVLPTRSIQLPSYPLWTGNNLHTCQSSFADVDGDGLPDIMWRCLDWIDPSGLEMKSVTTPSSPRPAPPAKPPAVSSSPAGPVANANAASSNDLICGKLKWLKSESGSTTYEERAAGCVWVYTSDCKGNIETEIQHVCTPPNLLIVQDSDCPSFGCDCSN